VTCDPGWGSALAMGEEPLVGVIGNGLLVEGVDNEGVTTKASDRWRVGTVGPLQHSVV
jgi:hypothetical protein